MPSDNSKYGISRADIERAAFGDFDDYEPEDSVQQGPNIANVQSVPNNDPVDVYSNVQTDYNNVVFCTSCGAQLPADSLFCTSCGASVNPGYDDGQQQYNQQNDQQYGQQYDQQYDQQYGQQYGQQYDQQYGQQYDQQYGQQYDQQYGQQYDQQYGQQYDQQYGQQYDNGQYGAAVDGNAVFCVSCGNQVSADYQFCTVCGTPVGSGYDDSQQKYQQSFDNGQMYDDDSPTIAADSVLNGGQYAQYADAGAYGYDAQPNQYPAADSLVFCTGCGAQISSSLKFCTSCGTPVNPDAGYAAQPAPAAKGGLFSRRKKK